MHMYDVQTWQHKSKFTDLTDLKIHEIEFFDSKQKQVNP